MLSQGLFIPCFLRLLFPQGQHIFSFFPRLVCTHGLNG
jgi:hypothetical protein